MQSSILRMLPAVGMTEERKGKKAQLIAKKINKFQEKIEECEAIVLKG